MGSTAFHGRDRGLQTPFFLGRAPEGAGSQAVQLRWLGRCNRERPMAHVLMLALALQVAPAAACPYCVEGRQARSEVLSEGFAFNLAACALPFLVIGAVCARAEKIGRRQ